MHKLNILVDSFNATDDEKLILYRMLGVLLAMLSVLLLPACLTASAAPSAHGDHAYARGKQ